MEFLNERKTRTEKRCAIIIQKKQSILETNKSLL